MANSSGVGVIRSSSGGAVRGGRVGTGGISVRIIGVPELIAKLTAINRVARIGLGKLNHEAANGIVERAQAGVNSITGNLASGIKATQSGPYSWEVTASSRDGNVGEKNSKEYAGYVEYGTSKMSARPYLRPAVTGARPVIVAGLTAIARWIEAL